MLGWGLRPCLFVCLLVCFVVCLFLFFVCCLLACFCFLLFVCLFVACLLVFVFCLFICLFVCLFVGLLACLFDLVCWFVVVVYLITIYCLLFLSFFFSFSPCWIGPVRTLVSNGMMAVRHSLLTWFISLPSISSCSNVRVQKSTTLRFNCLKTDNMHTYMPANE